MSRSENSTDQSPSPGSVNAIRTKGNPLAVLTLCLLLGLAGGGIAGLIMHRTIEFFPVIEPPEVANTQGIYTPEQSELVQKAQLKADFCNTSLNAGLLGLVVCAMLGLAPGIVRRVPGAALSGFSVGALTGAAFGAAGGFLAVVVREQLLGWNVLTDVGQPFPLKVQIHTMAIQFPSWAGIALALGCAFAAGSKNSRKAFGSVCGAAVAGWIVASLLYPATSSLFFSGDNPDAVIPNGFGNRILWTSMSASVIGLFVGRTWGKSESAFRDSR